MLRAKNLSPARLSLIVALSIGISSSLMLFLFKATWLQALINFGIITLGTYFLVVYLIDHFIYRKVKLIYKFISQTKATRREEFYNAELLPQKNLEEVSEEVAKWALERRNEIERLQNNEQFRKEFLMNLAHELKTPIFSAQGYIETLIDGAIDDDKVRHTFLEKAGLSLERLSELVHDLDEISKLESNQLPIHKTSFTIQSLIRQVYEEMKQRADKKHIRLQIKKGCEQDIDVVADKMKIRQVLVNLIENSINYGKEGGETTAGVYIIDSDHVYIEITDDGMGIQDEQIPRVFERFYRTDSARNRNAGGTGLGLAIVKHIIEAHNHNVSCRSKLDVGTSFGFTLDRK